MASGLGAKPNEILIPVEPASRNDQTVPVEIFFSSQAGRRAAR